MKQEIMLPKITLPGQSSWVTKALLIGGGAVVAMLCLVVIVLLSRQKAAPVQVAAPAVAVPAPVAAVPVTPQPADPTNIPVTPQPVAQAAAAPEAAEAHPARKTKATAHARRSASKPTRTLAARASGGGAHAAAAKPAAKRDPVIDDLLRKMR